MKNRLLSLKAASLSLGGALFLASAGFAATLPDAAAPDNTQSLPSADPSSSSPSAPAKGAPGAIVPDSAKSGSAAAEPQAAGRFTDAEILALVLAVDENEIAAAARAEKQGISADAKSYAKMLRKEHKQNAGDTHKLAKRIGKRPSDSKAAIQLRARGKEELIALSAKQGAEFEKAYLDAMVAGHTEALDLIDTQLLPSAKDESLKAHLNATREHVAMHLEQGKRLQQNAQAAAPTAD